VTSPTQIFSLDLAERAVATFIQGAVASAAVICATVEGSDVASASWWQQLGAALISGGLAAILAMAKGIIAGAKTGTASVSTVVANSTPGTAAVITTLPDPTPDPVTVDSILPPTAPAEPPAAS